MTIHARSWWVVVLRGVAAILFGLAAFVIPGITLLTLVAFFGAYVLVDGVFSIIAGVRAGQRAETWWPEVLEGVLGIAAGLATFFWPGITALILLYIIGFWAIFTGIVEVVQAIRLRREIENEWLLGLAGIASLLFGLFVVLMPGAGALTVVWLIGGYAILFGVVLIALGFRLKGIQEQEPTTQA